MNVSNKDLEEVLDEINNALNDPRGLVAHQKRIGFFISFGAIALIEIYLKKSNVFKLGSKIDHRWLKRSKENVKKVISKYITCSIEELKNFDDILEIAYKIESSRNNFVYGKEISEEELRAYIDLFFELRRSVENA